MVSWPGCLTHHSLSKLLCQFFVLPYQQSMLSDRICVTSRSFRCSNCMGVVYRRCLPVGFRLKGNEVCFLIE